MKRIVCIQPALTQHAYSTQDSFYRALRTYLQEAQNKGWLSPHTVVCFPEYIGTWLLFLNAPRFVLNAKTFKQALMRTVLLSIVKMLPQLIKAKAQARIAEALFKTKSQQMAAVYQTTFSKLAQEFNVTLVGGSIVLPEPRLENERLILNFNGPLRNVSCVWDAAGKIQHLVIKRSPTAPELQFTKGDATSLSAPIDTPAGKLGVVICGDGWEQKTYDLLAAQHADAIVVLAFVPADVAWDGPWQGYSGKLPEADVNKRDIGVISEYEAWKKYCLMRAKKTNKPCVVFYNRTQLWDFGSYGHPMVLQGNIMKEYQTSEDGEAVICLTI